MMCIVFTFRSSIIFIFTGSALVFIVYPEVLSKLPGAQFWCFIFFLMLVTLGLDSQVCNSTLVNLYYIYVCVLINDVRFSC